MPGGFKGFGETCKTKKKNNNKTNTQTEVHGTDRLCPVLTRFIHSYLPRRSERTFPGDGGVFFFAQVRDTGGNAGREVINKYAFEPKQFLFTVRGTGSSVEINYARLIV